MASGSSHDSAPDVVRFPAAWEWSCTQLAWLPRAAMPPGRDATAAALQGIRAMEPGAAREAALQMHLRGRVRVVAAGGGPRVPGLAAPFPGSWRRDPRMQGPCVVAGAVAAGVLDEQMVPLWASLAAAAGLARAFGGLVLDPGSPRALPPDDVIARPPFRIVEHVLVLSSVDEAGRGWVTTMGMERLGLPELEAKDLPPRAIVGFCWLLNGLAWHVLQQALATEPRGVVRQVVTPAEVVVQRAFIDAAVGHAGPGRAPMPDAPDPPPPLRLKHVVDACGTSWLRVGPPAGWRAGRRLWARAMVELAGAPWVDPPEPRCGCEAPDA